MSTWIDFRELRGSLDFVKVLAHYGIEPRIRGRQHKGFCPLPTHNGQKRSPSFSVNLDRKAWQCFGCGAHGNVLDFAARMEGFDPSNSSDIRKTALRLQELFGPESPNKAAQKQVADNAPVPTKGKDEPVKTELPVLVNAPLDFELKGLDAKHPYLTERGFVPKTVEYFGLGYCGRGLLKGRIAIPIHNDMGQLVGYAGRLVDEAELSEDSPKYKLPPARERDGKRIEFHKSLLLYNAHRLARPAADLIIVEGYPSVWWLWQNGYADAVALMGSSCSDEQAKLICDSTAPDSRIWLMPDGNGAGERCTHSVLMRLAPHRLIRWIKLDQGSQPTDLDAVSLGNLLNGLANKKGDTPERLPDALPASESNGETSLPTAAT